MRKLLVIVDMVNGFINFGALADKRINKITPNIVKLINCAKNQGVEIVAFRDCHEMGDEEFKTYPPHCLKGTEEAELIPEIKKYSNSMIIIDKNTTNGFNTKEFRKIANAIEFDKVYVVGCCTDICVKDFVTSYLNFNKINNRKTEINVIEDACYTFDNPTHNAVIAHAKAVEEMKKLGAKLETCNKQKNKE